MLVQVYQYLEQWDHDLLHTDMQVMLVDGC